MLQKNHKEQRFHSSVWVTVIWLVFVAQGLAAAVADLFFGTKIALPGILDACGIPMPWWSGLVLAALGGLLLIWLYKRDTQAKN